MFFYRVKQSIKKYLPESFLIAYHWLLALLANVLYSYPSRQLVVIGVTGTKGKTTTCLLLAHLLNQANLPVGLISGVVFQVGSEVRFNDLKMTMPGRFKLQQLLRAIVRAGCRYVIIETTSEGIKQFRHLGVNYDVAVLTNLTPEHIEAHGSFENYRQAKLKLFRQLARSRRKKINNLVIPKVAIVNSEVIDWQQFLDLPIDKKIVFLFAESEKILPAGDDYLFLKGESISLGSDFVEFTVQGRRYYLPLLGKFNAVNALAAIASARALGLDEAIIQKALVSFAGVPGRQELINLGQSFKVMIDYAHEPHSLQSIFQAVKAQLKPERIIHVTGSAGGGRDRAKRYKIGEISAHHSAVTIITNEDPYDEDPWSIINQIAAGASDVRQQQILEKKTPVIIYKILNRRLAIKKAFQLAQPGDLVLLTGKGHEQAIVMKAGKKIPWDEKQVTKDLLRELK